MTTQIFKTALAGILAGIALFMLPFFLLRVAIFFLIIGAIFRLLGGRRHSKFGRRMHPAYAHRYQQMSEEEREVFKQKYGNRCGYYSREEESEFNHNQQK